MGKKKQQVKSALVQLAENRSGLKNLPEYIDENYQAKNRWTLIQDFEEHSLKFFKFRSVTVNLCIKSEVTLSNLRESLVKAFNDGQWLVLNMGFMEIDLRPISHPDYFPAEVLNPIKLFMENTLDRLRSQVPDPFEIKDQFRVIVVSRNVDFDQNLIKNFAFVRIDEDIVKDEQREAKLLARKKANVKMQKLNQDLFEAAFEGQLDKVMEFIEDGADTQFRDPHWDFPLGEAALKVSSASKQGHYQVVQYLLTYQEPGVDPNQTNDTGRTALHKAAFNGHFKIVQLLLNHGCDPRIKDEEAATAIDVTNNNACKTALVVWDVEETDRIVKERFEKIEMREQLGVQNEQKNKKKERERIKAFLVECAVNGRYVQIEEIILNKEAIVDIRDGHGCSLLSLACQYNHFECVRKLIVTLNANINSRDNKGWTPLAYCAHLGYSKIVRLLLEKGADPTIPTNKNKFPAQIAKNEEIVEIIDKRHELKNSTKFEQMIDGIGFREDEAQESSSEEEGNLGTLAKPGQTVYENFYSPKKKKKKRKANKAKQPVMQVESIESLPSFQKNDPLYGSPLFPYTPNIIPNCGYFAGKKQDAICPSPPDMNSILEIVKQDFIKKGKKKPPHKTSPYRRTPRKKSRSKSKGKLDLIQEGSPFLEEREFLRIMPVGKGEERKEEEKGAERGVKWGKNVILRRSIEATKDKRGSPF